MAREVSGLQAHVEKEQQEKELIMRSYEGKQGAQAQWEDKCKALEAEAARQAEEAALEAKRGERKERKALSKAEQKARRDARYAARKARN